MNRLKSEYDRYVQQLSQKSLPVLPSDEQEKEAARLKKNELIYKQTLLESKQYKELFRIVHSQDLKDLLELVFEYFRSNQRGVWQYMPAAFLGGQPQVKIKEEHHTNPWYGSTYRAEISLTLRKNENFVILAAIESVETHSPNKFTLQVPCYFVSTSWITNEFNLEEPQSNVRTNFVFNSFQDLKEWIFARMHDGNPLIRGKFHN